MVVIGITGGIASGKSIATAYIRRCGYTVLDADEIVHSLQQPGEKLYQVIFENFGPTFFGADKCLDREKLGRLIFSDLDARIKLSKIQDEIIRRELIRQKDEQTASLFFMAIPLLFEYSYELLLDSIWLIDVPESLQLTRLQARNMLTEEEAKKRLAAQFPPEKKRERADIILDNSGTVEQLYRQLDKELELVQNGK